MLACQQTGDGNCLMARCGSFVRVSFLQKTDGFNLLPSPSLYLLCTVTLVSRLIISTKWTCYFQLHICILGLSRVALHDSQLKIQLVLTPKA